MSTQLLERIRATSTAHTTPSGGSVEYYVKPGEQVERFQPLALVAGFDEITAKCSGRVKLLTISGEREASAGEVVCYIEPAQPASASPPPRAGERAQRARRAAATFPPGAKPSQSAPERSQAPLAGAGAPPPGDAPSEPPAPVARPGRRSTMSPAAELVIEELEPDPAPPVTVKRHTIHLSTDQIKALRTQSYRYKLELGPEAYSQSEIARAALQMFLDLPASAQAAVLAENRRREEAGQWGAGYPRPS